MDFKKISKDLDGLYNDMSVEELHNRLKSAGLIILDDSFGLVELEEMIVVEGVY